jgi:hypothetical protein
MNPLPSTNWPGVATVDGAVRTLCEHLALIYDDSLQGDLKTASDYAQLKVNIEWLKTGFERIEKLLIENAR